MDTDSISIDPTNIRKENAWKVLGGLYKDVDAGRSKANGMPSLNFAAN